MTSPSALLTPASPTAGVGSSSGTSSEDETLSSSFVARAAVRRAIDARRDVVARRPRAGARARARDARDVETRPRESMTRGALCGTPNYQIYL